MSDGEYKLKKVEVNKSGIIGLLQSQEIMTMLESVAQEQFGEIESTFIGFDRCHVVCKDSGGN